MAGVVVAPAELELPTVVEVEPSSPEAPPDTSAVVDDESSELSESAPPSSRIVVVTSLVSDCTSPTAETDTGVESSVVESPADVVVLTASDGTGSESPQATSIVSNTTPDARTIVFL
ncbi:hypothetical protein JYT71_01145 [Acidimicrobiaceae bacterium AH-315-P05]|nr:hypothetical protein [Acidimicrobiaceae bacterium AH-315-P05]